MSEAETIGSAIDIARPQFEKISEGMPLFHRLNYEAEQRFAIQHLQTNSYLMKVARENPSSLQAAMCNLAGVGLSLNPALKFAYLIPRNIKVDNNKWETRIYAEPSYMGMTRLATDTGSIKWCQARLVYSDDTYAPASPGNAPEHVYDPFKKDRGDIIGVYCVAMTADGDTLTDEMSIDRVNEIRDRTEIFKAAAKKGKEPYGPWVTDYIEQVLKTCVRHAYKLWPKTSQSSIMAEAVQMSNDNMGYEPILNNPETTQITAEGKAYFDQLIASDDNLGMHVLQQTISSGEMANLYNSFESEITKYKRVADGMLEKGRKEFDEYVVLLGDALASGDESGIGEVRLEVSEDAFELILKEAGER